MVMNVRPLDTVPIIALRALPVIRETGSMTRAAMALGVSQPAISRAIAALEDKSGVVVTRRMGGQIRLTAEGDRLAELGRREALLRQDAWEDVTALKRKKAGALRIGSIGASASTRLLPQLLGRYQSRCPEIRLAVREIPETAMAEALKTGVVDVAITLAQDDPSLEQLPLTDDHLVALMPDDRVWPERLTPQDLATLPFVMTKGGSEPLVRAWFALAGVTPDIRHEAQQITSLLALVRAGLGAAIIADLAAPEHHPGLLKVPLDPPAPREIVLARLAGGPASEALSAFWELI
nr:LysR family transcriptional regulator [Phaeobacter inhibens]